MDDGLLKGLSFRLEDAGEHLRAHGRTPALRAFGAHLEKVARVTWQVELAFSGRVPPEKADEAARICLGQHAVLETLLTEARAAYVSLGREMALAANTIGQQDAPPGTVV